MIDGRKEKWLCVLLTALATAAFVGCGGGDGFDAGLNNVDYPGTPTMGATPGGAQDIAYARALIDAGSIPPASAITVEGLLSEHDLPISGEACEDLLCVRPAVGVARSLATGENETWIHLGMASGLARDFERPPLDVVVVVDKSSAMSVDMAETNDAVLDIARQLGAGDRLAIVTFDDVATTLAAPTEVGGLDFPELERRVRGIVAAGGANMMAGLDRGYELARSMTSGSERLSRVILLSCGYPDLYDNHTDSFVGVVEAGASEGIGLTFLGVLLSFDYELAQRLSTFRGGNYYYIEDLERLEQLFEEDFDSIVTPLAYDLQLKLGLDPARWKIAQVYGIPGQPDAATAGFAVTTAFASRRGGGMVVRLRSVGSLPDGPVGEVALRYEPEVALGWTAVVERTTSAVMTDRDNTGVRKSVAVVNTAEQLRAALEQHDVAALVELRTYLRAEALALGDEDLQREVDMVEKLIQLF